MAEKDFQIRTAKTIKNLDNRILKYDIQPWVFFGAAGLIFAGLIFTLIAGDAAEKLFSSIKDWMCEYTGWFMILTMNVVLATCIGILVSPLGKLRIGGPEAEPEFGYLSWFSMLFSAGMGIGLIFYGVAEPMFHYVANPLSEPGSLESAKVAMQLTYLHYGFHPWAVYALIGLGLAFFGFTKGLPLSIRNVFYPVLKERIYGGLGNAIDILATMSCLFGVATSLAVGVQQLNAGLAHLIGIPQNAGIQAILIACITAIATWSVVRGLESGIKFLSNINICLALLLMIFVFVLGPTTFVLNAMVENFGNYIQDFFELGMWSETYTDAGKWQNAWTIFYWAWWISWCPFVGMFIARISYGRSLREYLACVLVVPCIVTFIWMSVFGDSAIYIERFMAGGMAKAVQENIPISLFIFLENFPMSIVTSILAMVVVVFFFVTSSDSGSMVIDIITAGGNPDPPKPQRLFWAILEGAVAAILLLGGGFVALQTAAISTGLPFAVIMFLMCWAVVKGLVDHVKEHGYD